MLCPAPQVRLNVLASGPVKGMQSRLSGQSPHQAPTAIIPMMVRHETQATMTV